LSLNFPHHILQQIAHRPWPVPVGPWIMTQSWHDLLFAHWPVDARVLREKLPPELPLDLFEGQAWVGVVPFHMTNVGPRGVPWLPFVSAFAELNVRTYVTLDGKPGVYFFSLDAASALAVATARALLNLPYHVATMTVGGEKGRVNYRSRRPTSRIGTAEFVATYWPVGPPQSPQRGTLEYFLTERYCLYAVDRRRRIRRLEIHHQPWPLQLAAAEILSNTMAEASSIPLPANTPLLHFAKRLDVVAWPMKMAGV
jgi:uncharacterized protein YqjF (DUF2071 family)